MPPQVPRLCYLPESAPRLFSRTVSIEGTAFNCHMQLARQATPESARLATPESARLYWILPVWHIDTQMVMSRPRDRSRRSIAQWQPAHDHNDSSLHAHELALCLGPLGLNGRRLPSLRFVGRVSRRSVERAGQDDFSPIPPSSSTARSHWYLGRSTAPNCGVPAHTEHTCADAVRL